jgi:PDZ domain/Peptidase family M48
MTSGFSASMASELFRIEGADMKRAVPVLLLVLAACATPETQRPAVPSQATDEEARIQLALALNRRMDTRDQLWRVNYRLGAAAADLCGDHVVRVTGMLVQTIAAYGEQYRAAALARYPSLGAAPSVSNVAPGSAAEAAGLKTNDVITAINGEPIPAGDKPLDGYHALLRKASNGPVRFTIERGSTASEVTVEPRPYCNYRAYLVADKSEVNASTDGNVIQVYRGMMDFVRSDDELALVLGHEMAHDVGGHLAAKRKNATVGAVVGAVFDVLPRRHHGHGRQHLQQYGRAPQRGRLFAGVRGRGGLCRALYHGPRRLRLPRRRQFLAAHGGQFARRHHHGERPSHDLGALRGAPGGDQGNRRQAGTGPTAAAQ